MFCGNYTIQSKFSLLFLMNFKYTKRLEAKKGTTFTDDTDFADFRING